MKKKILCVLGITFLVLTGCTEQQEAKATDNSETVVIENEYREYDIYDYSDIVPNVISFYDTDNSSYMGNEVEDMDGLRVIYKKDILSEVDISSQESMFGSTISFIEKYFPSYVFGDENGVDIYYISMQDEYAYFKINIDDASQLLQNFSSYSTGDDVYMIVSGGLGKNTSGELGMKFNYFIKNFSLDEINGDTALNDGEMTYADWSTLCTEKTIQTELYSVTVPDSWMNTCAYDIGGDGNTLSFKIPKGYDGVNDSGLCTITIVYGSLRDILTPYMFIETIESELYGRMHLILEYPGDKQYSDTTEEEYLMLAEDIRLLVDSITLADGVEVISTVEPIYRDFDIYDYYDVVEKQLRYIESQEQKILQPYAELKEVYERDVVSFFQGREYDEYLIGECLIENEFNNANIKLECLGTYPVETGEYTAPEYYLYYKVNIMDIDNVRRNYNPDWNLDDDIYVIARTRFIFNQTEGAEEECFLIAYSVKNFSESN